ncbi:MAG: nitroreductase family deazaflavin-dependent oxidoreductase [Anaerolineae bacterium]|nr:nitroreductase family deazaflavin-dependent oxidoreductase [Anaerolineae bacterium]
MTFYDPETEQKARRTLKFINRAMIPLWRLGLGGWLNFWPKVGGRIMVIVHTGRKSGKRRYNNVNYSIINGDIYCTAGFGSITDWYRNILNNPNVEVWLPDGWWNGIAEDVSYDQNRLNILRQVLIDSGFAARAMGIEAATIPAEVLERVTQDYRLVRIRRTAARTGAGGPGNLAWVWPLSTFILLGLLIFRPRHGKKG